MDMTEGPPQTPESETAPTPEEIKDVFERLTRSGRYTEMRRLEDERGIYLWEISIETEDGHTEYEYNRAGPNPKGKGLQTAVYATYYRNDGMPISGASVAELRNNVWNTELIDLRTWLPKT